MTSERRPNGVLSTGQTDLQESFPLGRFSPQRFSHKQLTRQQSAPALYPLPKRRLDEFSKRETTVPPPVSDGVPGKQPTRSHTAPPTAVPRPSKEPLSIKPMRFSDFLSDGVALYVSHVLHPSRIPGSDLISKVYAMGVLPVLIIALTVIQWSIGLLVIVVNHTRVGAHYYDVFFKDQIALFDETGNDEAVRQLVDRTPRQTTHFSYHIANMLLIMSSMSYQRDDKLVAEASKILANCKTPEQRDEAARLLQESERLIDENASREFGMRFMGISELKTLGGPFAGLFYNDDTIVLVYKGTSVLAFNEYLLDVTIQRVDASEYLYGEVHKGFYESLFPDPIPQNWYESMTYDQTNPFKTIMETIFDVAKAGKSKTGKPVNLWLTGHSLGGALAALTMARLQMVVKEEDPLMNKDKDNDDITSEKPHGLGVRTVLEEMLARYSNDPDLLVLRDCYTVASPKVGDSIFADEFARNHLHYCAQSPYKSTYWRLVADKDVAPRNGMNTQSDKMNGRGARRYQSTCIHCWTISTLDSLSPYTMPKRYPRLDHRRSRQTCVRAFYGARMDCISSWRRLPDLQTA
ncbi:Alpha/Beta hydrolase protein [Mortierella sp. GBAus27b]|nr:Alpha/Beta hydrolase protein [Mortierella sp. GBAus27b]